jgi:hypothetical protein
MGVFPLRELPAEDSFKRHIRNAVFAAGWDERALHDAIAVTARAAFMQRLVEGRGFTPMTRDVTAAHAKCRVERGYVNLYPGLLE